MKRLIGKLENDISGEIRISVKKGFGWSVFVSSLLSVFVYRDIWYVRFVSDLLPNPADGSETFQDYLLHGFQDITRKSVVVFNRQMLLIVFCCLVGYAAFYSYKKLHKRLEANQSITVNSIQQSTLSVTFQFVLQACLAFCVPLIYWAMFLVVLLPKLTALPLKSLATGDINQTIVTFVVFFACTTLLVHLGVVISRISIRVLNR